MGTDMRLEVQTVSGTNGSWYVLFDKFPERDYDAWAWYGRLGKEPVGGLSKLALRGLPADDDMSSYAARCCDEAGYSHSWCYLSELMSERQRPERVDAWASRLLTSLGDVAKRDPETIRLVWSFAY
jgi:hypothetical protein